MDTIAAISTAQGAGGIGVIRISGKQAIQIADAVFRPISGKALIEQKGYTAAFGHIYGGNEKIDEGIALVFRAPHSYTGEDVVELSCHGGIYLTKRVLRAVFQAGAIPAQAGEFTKRAFLNGKMDLTQAESVMDLIGAKGKHAARAALSCKEGSLRKKIDAVCTQLTETAAHLSAWADYPEEDIPELSSSLLTQNLKESQSALQTLLSGYDTGKVVREGVDTLIVGKPNVGKSTLMNLLSGCERSIVTDIPGTTRDIVEETVLLGNTILRLSDTAGLRDTDNPIEKIGVDKAKERIKSCGLVLAVFDGSSPLEKDDRAMLDLLCDAPAVAVVNKADKGHQIDTAYIAQKVKALVHVSAAKGQGIQALTDAVEAVTGTKDFDPSQAILATERQRAAVEKALCALEEAIGALQAGFTLDAVTVSLEDAISALLTLTGKRVSEAVVETVFSRFCVGK
ncbi:MAG TPA: tRNA uridine-5-carboxymethylaminomethyl(34) synthesis GTPase MnmE [Candidatus Scatovicinus merdipullorum]|nr:tRNA uridine-5-carboxymethylaminomethyl(34) synthesis GTPase MnmE [Candidatus Scatovicinus merdipullorum]